jgi:alpha-glucosidase
MVLAPEWTRAVHHDGSEVFVSNPYPALGETVTLRIRVPSDAPIASVFCRLLEDGEFRHLSMCRQPTGGMFDWWVLDWTLHQTRTEYSFKLLSPEGAFYYSTQGASRADHPLAYDFVILANYQAPHWVRETVFYQIFPDRFYNGDPSLDVQDGEWEREGALTRRLAWGELPLPWEEGRSVDFANGDLPGIRMKLEHIAELGANGIYLTPIFKSASNHRYDISDFAEVDPHLGGNQALADLRAAMDERAMRLMLDITPNHVGVTHHWYQDVLSNPTSPYAEFFIRTPDGQHFETWLGVPSLLKLNYHSDKLRDAMYRAPDSAIRRWLAQPYRIDGWRLDVANMTGNLREAQLDHEVWQEMRPYAKADNPDVYLMGEYFQDATPHTQGTELDAAMNYQGFNIPTRRWLGGEDIGVADGKPFGDPTLLPTEALAEQYRRFMGAVPYVIALQQFNQISSHDITRILRVVQGDKALVKLGTALLMCFPGVPCLYYGDEIGLDGGRDPDNRRCMPWDESEWDHDLLAHTRRWVQLRRQHRALQSGGYQLLYAEGDTLAFLRQTTDQRLVFVGHRGQPTIVTIPLWLAGCADGETLSDLVSGAAYNVENGGVTLQLGHGEALLLG